MGHNNKTTTLAETAKRLRAGEVSATALWDTMRQCHDSRGDAMNAYAVWADGLAMRMANVADEAFAAGLDLGPLQGLPVSFKDHYGVSGLPTYAGTSKQLPTKWENEGPIVKEAKKQLAVLVGKTHSVELAASVIGDNPHWGAPRNPWDADTPRGTGGSSSGAVASLWEGSSLAAFGTDTRGSVRIPGAMTGAVGLKTTAGRWSTEGIVPLDPQDDTPGPLTLSVEDAAFVFSAIDPAHSADPQALLDDLSRSQPGDFIIGLADSCYWDECSPGIAEVVRQALAELETAGARLQDVVSPACRELQHDFSAGRIPMPELFSFLEDELPEWIEQLEPRLTKRLKYMERLTATDYLTSKSRVRSLASAADECFANVDVIACPTVPRTPPKLADGAPEYAKDDPPELAWARNTAPANFFGWCAITLPVGLDSESMPVGLQFMAAGGSEEKLLAVALAAERKLGTVTSRIGKPPLLK
jgi:aspartyl-tRNA(Asn)/glutamyl-tRNA(Gln) amidotransferase subunit A